MKLEAVQPLAALFVALGFVLGTVVTAAPASAQDSGQIPWYMPQPWVYPPQTGPKIRKLPGTYGYSYRNKTYGSFANYCYGDCGYRAPGTVSTGGGVILKRPAVVSYDQDDYMIVPRTLYEAPQPVVQRKAPITPAVVPANQLRGYKPKPTVTMQNGVRVIQLTPLAKTPKPAMGY
ncbi:MAG: hypothetical protein HC861_08250 [Rhodospirillaceae bacterium]|nr:hypothetical protein [Rhodospirillaceae bacterium]